MCRNISIAIGFLFWLFGESSGQSQDRLVRRLLTIPVEVNNTAGMFLVDTGSDRTIIDLAFAQSLGLKSSGTVSVERNYSTDEQTTTIAERVRIGPKKWSAVPLVMLDISMLSKIQMTPISGILGTDLIETMTMRLSYSSGVAEVVDETDKKGFRVALDKVRNRYFVPVTIGTTTLEMLLDSGTNMTAMSAHGWELLPLSSRASRTSEGIKSSGSPAAALIACIPSIQVGDAVLHEHPIRVITPPSSGSFADAAFAGILGGDILERFELTLDLKHSAMYLKYDDAFRADPYEFVTVGIQFFKSRADAFSVAAVWKGSPAEGAGIIVGDRIISVNGHASADLDEERFSKELHGAAGTPVTLDVERPSGKATLRMKTRQLVCESGTGRL